MIGPLKHPATAADGQLDFERLPVADQRAYEHLVARGIAEIIQRELALEDPSWNRHIPAWAQPSRKSEEQ